MINFDIESFVRKYMTKRPESLLAADFAKCAEEMHKRIDGKRRRVHIREIVRNSGLSAPSLMPRAGSSRSRSLV